MFLWQDQRIAVREKDTPDLGIGCPRDIEILKHLLKGTDAELLFLIHVAERTLIVRASDGCLYDQAIGFTGRAKNTASITHRFSLLIFQIG